MDRTLLTASCTNRFLLTFLRKVTTLSLFPGAKPFLQVLNLSFVTVAVFLSNITKVKSLETYYTVQQTYLCLVCTSFTCLVAWRWALCKGCFDGQIENLFPLTYRPRSNIVSCNCRSKSYFYRFFKKIDMFFTCCMSFNVLCNFVMSFCQRSAAFPRVWQFANSDFTG